MQMTETESAYDDDWNLVCVKSALVDGEAVKADTSYRLTTAGDFIEVEGA